MTTSWKVDSTTSSPLDARAVVEHNAIGQWDLVHPETGARLRPVLVIERVTLYKPAHRRKKKLSDGSEVEEPLNKLRIEFRGQKKFWICNQVNRKTLITLYGPIMQGWIGKSIQLYVDEAVTFGTTKTGGVRIVNVKPSEAPMTGALEGAAP